MGMYRDHSVPRSARGERGDFQDGAWFGPWQCDETHRLGRVSEPMRKVRKNLFDEPRWVISLLKLENGRWVSDSGGCWVAGPNSKTYPSRKSALRGIIIRTARQVRRQYLATEPQRYLIGIEAEELQVVLRWAISLLDRPEPKRVKRAQRRTLLETAREG